MDKDNNNLSSLNNANNIETSLEMPKVNGEQAQNANVFINQNNIENQQVINQTQNVSQVVNTPQEEISTISESKTIGTLKPDKQKSPLAMIVLFSFLVIFVIFMPEIMTLVNKYLGTNFEPLDGQKIQEIYESEEDEEDESKIYDLTNTTVINFDKVAFSSFVKTSETTGYKISFTIKNENTKLYTFAKKLYLDFYDDTNTIVGRAYLDSIKEITGGVTNDYTVFINKDIYDKATKLSVVERTDEDYPKVSLVSNMLTCTNDTYNLVYTFDDNQRLTYIKDVFTYKNELDEYTYANDLVAYKAKINNLDAQEGVTAVLTENATGFITTVVIDYSQADYTKLSSDTNYYMKDTYAKVISFEMNAKGYTCR